jgi:hypothetical protein
MKPNYQAAWDWGHQYLLSNESIDIQLTGWEMITNSRIFVAVTMDRLNSHCPQDRKMAFIRLQKFKNLINDIRQKEKQN